MKIGDYNFGVLVTALVSGIFSLFHCLNWVYFLSFVITFTLFNFLIYILTKRNKGRDDKIKKEMERRQ